MKNSFRLAGIDYNVCDTDVCLRKHNRDIILSVEIEFETDNDDLDFELCQGSLYHHNGFNTHIQNRKDLVGAKFVWAHSENEEGVEAGYFAMLEHESVTSGVIEVLDITDSEIRIKWTGTANIYWNEEFGENVPFETEFTAAIETKITNHVLMPFASTKMAIDEHTEIEVLNFPEFQSAIEKVDNGDGWRLMETPLNLAITHKGSCYKGYIDLADGNREKWQLRLDQNCPINIQFQNIGFNTKVEYMEILLDVAPSAH